MACLVQAKGDHIKTDNQICEKCDIWQNFSFYRTFNNKNFKMEIEQTNFVTHLIITVQSYY